MIEGKHHNSALCSVSAVLITRIAACWRKGELYELRDEDGKRLPRPRESRCTTFKIDPTAGARRGTPPPKTSRTGGGSRQKGVGPKVAPATDPPGEEASENVA